MGTKKQLRAGCYCRISSDPKDKREGVDRQREDTADICAINGWTPAGFYIDNDRSASNGKKRDEWDRLLADVKARKLDAIVVWNQDRGWRKMADLESLRPLLEPRGVLLATTNIGVIDFRNADDVFRAQVSTAMSEMEIAKMKVRMRRAAREKAEKGLPKWQRAFGYLPTPDGPVPDPAIKPLVAQGYAAVLAGGSIADVARAWNAAGALTATGKPWTVPLASQFLRKPRNAGLRAHNSEIVGRGTWEPLVDESTWRAAQTVLTAPGRGPGRRTVRRHLLTGVLQCGRDGCGGYLLGQKTSRGNRVYFCGTCHGVTITAAHVEDDVYDVVSGRLAMPDAVDLLKAQHDEAQAEALRLRANAYNVELDNIAVERAEGLLTGRQAKIATDRLTEKLAAVERAQRNNELVRVFEGIPLGTPQAAAAVRKLSADRFRAVVDVLVTVTIEPVGQRGGKVFNPDRVSYDWR
jgi:DNA invertase Pin-like site-specific DNA recombinase